MYFLQSELPVQSSEDDYFQILQVPLEKSVSYGKGTGQGPTAIINASQELELFDGYSVPAEHGIYTHPEINAKVSLEIIFNKMDILLQQIFAKNKFPIILGGEHTLTLGTIKSIKNTYSKFGIIQFDAHADLRDSYQDNPFSHACVMKRIYDLDIPIFQIGIRSISTKEHILRKNNNIFSLDAEFLAENGIPDVILPPEFPEMCFLTIDVDVFCPSLIPSTGTPEPGGLTWYQVWTLMKKIIHETKIIGFDVVELAPIENLHAPDFVIARLIYNIMGLIARNYLAKS